MQADDKPVDPGWCADLFRQAVTDYPGLELDLLNAEAEVRFSLRESASGRHLLTVIIWREDDLQLRVGDHGDIYDFCATEQETVDEVGRWMRAVLVDGYEELVGRRLGRKYLLAVRLGAGMPVYRTRVAGLVLTIRGRFWRRVLPFARWSTQAVLGDSVDEFSARLREVVEASGPVTDLQIVPVRVDVAPGGADAILDLYYDLGDVDAFIMLAAWRGRPTSCRLQFTGGFEIDQVTIEQACAVVAAAAAGRLEPVPRSFDVDVVIEGIRYRVTECGLPMSPVEVRTGPTGAGVEAPAPAGRAVSSSAGRRRRRWPGRRG